MNFCSLVSASSLAWVCSLHRELCLSRELLLSWACSRPSASSLQREQSKHSSPEYRTQSTHSSPLNSINVQPAIELRTHAARHSTHTTQLAIELNQHNSILSSVNSRSSPQWKRRLVNTTTVAVPQPPNPENGIQMPTRVDIQTRTICKKLWSQCNNIPLRQRPTPIHPTTPNTTLTPAVQKMKCTSHKETKCRK